MPYAVVCHSAVGLWMHTHFATDFQAQLSTLSSASSGINDKGVSDALSTLSRSDMFNRVVQANGLSLLFLLLIMVFYMVVVRWGDQAGAGAGAEGVSGAGRW